MKSLLLRTYTFVFLNDFVLIYPLYAVMFTDHGLSTAQVAAIMAVWSGTVFVLEIPSGVLADKMSRRHLMALGQISRAMGYALWLFYPGFWGYLAGFLLWGVKSAVTHGTFEAWFYDELKARGEAARYAQCYSHARAISFVAILAASGGASLAILLGYKFVLAVSVGSGIIAGAFVLTLPAAPKSCWGSKEESEETLPYLKLLKLGLQTAASDPVILRIMIFAGFVAGLIGTLDEFWPIFADMAGAANWGIPLFVGVLSALQGLAAFQAWRTEGWSNRTFYLWVIGAGTLLMVAAFGMNLWVLPLIVLGSIIDALVKVVFDARLQHAIGSEARATVSSVKGLVIEVFGLFSLGTFGFVSASFGAQVAFITMGAVIASGGAIFALRSLMAGRSRS